MSIAIPGSPLSDDDLRAWLKGQAGTGVHEAIRSIVTELLARREADRAGQSLADLESALVELGATEVIIDPPDSAVKRWEVAIDLPGQPWECRTAPTLAEALTSVIEAIVSHREGAAMLASRGGR